MPLLPNILKEKVHVSCTYQNWRQIPLRRQKAGYKQRVSLCLGTSYGRSYKIHRIFQLARRDVGWGGGGYRVTPPRNIFISKAYGFVRWLGLDFGWPSNFKVPLKLKNQPTLILHYQISNKEPTKVIGFIFRCTNEIWNKWESDFAAMLP